MYQLIIDPIHKMPAVSPLREWLSRFRETFVRGTPSDHRTESYIERSESRRLLYTYRGLVPDDLILRRSQLSRLEPGTSAERAFGGSANIECVYYLGKKFAVKILRTYASVKTPCIGSLKKEFYHEMAIWYNLQHDHILQLVGVVRWGPDDALCMVSPWQENGNAQDYLDVKKSELPDPEYIKIVDELLLQILYGLEYMHQNGVVHGDLKGRNILIGNNKKALICDFGLSTCAEIDSKFEPSLECYWMAPEVRVNSKTPTPAADIYSFGCLCIGFYTLDHPFRGSQHLATLEGRAMLHQPSNMNLTRWEVVRKCCKTKPSDRPTIDALIGHFSSHE